MQYFSSFRQPARSLTAALILLVGTVAAHGADTYDPTRNQLTVPAVAIGTTTLTNLVITAGTLVSRPSGTAPNANEDSYNPANQQLTIPDLKVGEHTYYNLVVTVSTVVSIGGVSGADTYDGTNLTIASVQLGNVVYTDVVVAATLANVVHVAGGMPAAVGDTYDAQTGELTIPAVQAGSHVYTNVTVAVGTRNVLSVGGRTSLACHVSGVSRDAFGCWDVNILTNQAGVPLFPENSTGGGLSCIPPGGAYTCLLIGNNVQYTVLRNGTWSAPVTILSAPGSDLGPPSCVAGGFCMVGGITNQGAPNVAGAWLVFDGTSWTTIASGNKSNESPEIGMWACGSASFCWAVITTQATNSPSTSFELLTETYGGTWSGYKLYPAQYKGGLFAMSCPPGGSLCVAVGNDVLLFQGGALVMSTPPTANGVAGVSCPTSAFCMMLDGGNGFLTYDPSAHSFTAPQPIIPAGATGYGMSFSAVSCASATFCVAISQSNYAITYVNGTWGVPDYVFGFPAMVSCPTEQNCYALVSTPTSVAVETYTRNP